MALNKKFSRQKSRRFHSIQYIKENKHFSAYQLHKFICHTIESVELKYNRIVCTKTFDDAFVNGAYVSQVHKYTINDVWFILWMFKRSVFQQWMSAVYVQQKPILCNVLSNATLFPNKTQSLRTIILCYFLWYAINIYIKVIVLFWQKLHSAVSNWFGNIRCILIHIK